MILWDSTMTITIEYQFDIPIRRGTGVLTNVLVREHLPFNNQIFWSSKVYYFLTPLSLLSWCRLSFPVVSLKIFSHPTFALKSPNSIFFWYIGKWSKTCSYSSKKLFFESSLFSSLGACTFRTMILHQQPFRTIYDILSLTNSTLLTL